MAARNKQERTTLTDVDPTLWWKRQSKEDWKEDNCKNSVCSHSMNANADAVYISKLKHTPQDHTFTYLPLIQFWNHQQQVRYC